MTTRRYSAIVYERPGPLSDMFVPHRVSIAPAPPRVRRAPALISAVLLMFALPALAFHGSTGAFFTDEEQSTGNTFAAGPLDITVAADHAEAILMAGGDAETFTITLSSGAYILPFKYRVTGFTSGSAVFCNAITASGGAPLAYDGPAKTLVAGDTSDTAPWQLALTLPAGAPGVVDGQKCILDLKYEAYQEGGAPGTEYHDTEHVLLTLTADPPVAPPPAPMMRMMASPSPEALAPQEEQPTKETAPPLGEPTADNPPSDEPPAGEETPPVSDEAAQDNPSAEEPAEQAPIEEVQPPAEPQGQEEASEPPAPEAPASDASTEEPAE